MTPGRSPDVTRRIIRALLRLYPAEFRARFGREIEQVVWTSRLERPNDSAMAFWLSVVTDVAAGAVRERVSTLGDGSAHASVSSSPAPMTSIISPQRRETV